MKKKHYIYILITYLWSWIFWGLAIYYSRQYNLPLLTNESLLKDILDGKLSGTKELTITTLSFLAGYGPLLAGLFVVAKSTDSLHTLKRLFNVSFDLKFIWQVLLIILLIGVVPVIILSVLSPNVTFNNEFTFLYIIGFSLVFFVYQFLTAATEEIGWRGFMLPSLLDGKKTIWKASVITGLFWAIWHYPIVLYIFFDQGQTIATAPLSLIGFTVGTIGMSAVHSYYLIKSNSVIISMFIHALFNSVPMTMGLLFSDAYTASLITQIGIWVVIAYIDKKKDKYFNQTLKF